MAQAVNNQPSALKVGYHTESKFQHQPASFSSAFKLSGTACLVGEGSGWGVPSSDWGHVMKEVTIFPNPSPPVSLSFHTSTGSLDPFY